MTFIVIHACVERGGGEEESKRKTACMVYSLCKRFLLILRVDLLLLLGLIFVVEIEGMNDAWNKAE